MWRLSEYMRVASCRPCGLPKIMCRLAANHTLLDLCLMMQSTVTPRTTLTVMLLQTAGA
jgi:hypothetical protein